MIAVAIMVAVVAYAGLIIGLKRFTDSRARVTPLEAIARRLERVYGLPVRVVSGPRRDRVAIMEARGSSLHYLGVAVDLAASRSLTLDEAISRLAS